MSKANRKVLLSILCAAMLIASFTVSGYGHKLSVFAWIEGDTVFVQGTLGGGKRPKRGMVHVYDGKDKLLLKTEVKADGTASFPLRDWETGLKIIMDIGEGHKSYWILTPYDIKNQHGQVKE
jgi:nickel transport protein